METINLDDSENNLLFVIDEEPSIEKKSNKQIKRSRRSLRRKLIKKMKLEAQMEVTKPQNSTNHYFVIGGGMSASSDDSTRNKSVENNNPNGSTIIIDDDDDDDEDTGGDSDDIIVLSDDEVGGGAVGIIGGELSFGKRKLNSIQRRVEKLIQSQKKTSPVICIDSNDNESSQTPPAGSSERKLRPVAIDGSNVAFGHGKSMFSSRGIQICCDYFLKRGHKVKVFVPQFRRRHMGTTDTHILDQLEKDGIIVFTPSRNVNGKNIVSYDDRMMVDYAAQSGAVIVTRDNLRDIAAESKEYEQIINDRILMFTWVDSEIILFPQDPLGRSGPRLDDFLSFPSENEVKTGQEEVKVAQKEVKTVKNKKKIINKVK